MANLLFDGSSIRSAEITGKETLVLKGVTVTEKDGIPVNDVVTVKRDRVPQKSLFTAFKKLTAHAMLIFEHERNGKIDEKYIKTGRIVDDPDFGKYMVTKFALKGDDEGTSITLTVTKTLHEGGKVSFDLPAVKLYQGSKYEYSGNLDDDFQDCLAEITKYLNGEYRENNQLKLNLDGNGDPDGVEVEQEHEEEVF